MKNAVFITGTDTDIGKTYVSCLLLKKFNNMGLKTFAIKPIASGCKTNDCGELRNEDALSLRSCSSMKRPYSVVNPMAFKDPIAPHIAASQEGTKLSKSLVTNKIIFSIQNDADINLIEGVGGWSVPLNDKELYYDVIVELGIPVILVVGIKLGCINHGMLTCQNILASNGNLIGWIANCLDDQTRLINENIQTLCNWIKVPCLGVITPFDELADDINIKLIQENLS